jgi:hypothetical protein
MQGDGMRVRGAQPNPRSSLESCFPGPAPPDRHCSEVYDDVTRPDPFPREIPTHPYAVYYSPDVAYVSTHIPLALRIAVSVL